MDFLYPSFLYALIALAIPIIIHLFFFRRFKKVYFTNVQFLKEVKEETSARRKLRNLLILLSRLFALAFLVFAFSQPFIPKENQFKKGRKTVGIFIDNSFSMNALSEDLSLLDKAKFKAKEIINAYAEEDKFQILTNDFEGRHQHLVGKEDALELIEEVKSSPSVKDISKILAKQQQVLNTSDSDYKISYVASDFQKNITDLENFQDTAMEVNLVAFQAVQEKNVAIDSAWFEAPVQMLNQSNQLLVKIRNISNEPVENIRLSLKHEGQLKPIGTISIPANASVVDTVPITILKTGWHHGELMITDFPIQFDDTYSFVYYVAEEIQVLVIDEQQANRYLQAAFEGISYFNLKNANVRSLVYADFANYQMIVLNELTKISSGLAFELKNYVSNGGNLLIFPSAKIDKASYKSFCNAFPVNEYLRFDTAPRKVGRVNTNEFIFNDVFENKSVNLKLPSTTGNYIMSKYAGRGEEQLLTFRDGSAYLSKFKVGQGHVYASSAPLNIAQNDIVQNSAIFVPMLYKMALSSAKENRLAYTIGQDQIIEVETKSNAGIESVFTISSEAGEFIPEQRIVGSKVFIGVKNQIKQSGVYKLGLRNGETQSQLAFNYDRDESVLNYYNDEELKALTDKSTAKYSVLQAKSETNFTELIGEQSRGIVLWRWALVLCLVFLAIEGLLLRFWKA